MDKRQRIELSRLTGGDIRFDCSMHEFTTFRVGGNVDILYFAGELDRLQRVMAFLAREKVPYIVLGKGSNLLVMDAGLKGAAVILRGKLAGIERSGPGNRNLLAGGGLSISKLLTYCRDEGLGGLEFMAGIPGTVGGALVMNAGAFGKAIGGMVEKIRMITPEGKLADVEYLQTEFSYRESSIPEGAVVIEVMFRLNNVNSEMISKIVAGYLAQRKEKQPLEYPSAGSIFKNPPHDYAGRLIEKVGLKGKKIGGAMISPKHANFIINTGGASADDILNLMEMTRKKVKQETGIDLESELKIVGIKNH